MTHKALFPFLLGMIASGSVLAAKPEQTVAVTATLTADDHYGLYVGKANGQGLTLVGRNESGTAGAPGTYGWSLPETWSVGLEPDDHLYVLAWDRGGPQGWLGEFSWAGGRLLSNAGDWQYTLPDRGTVVWPDRVPKASVIRSAIARADWQAPLASTPNGTGVWYAANGDQPIAGIPTDAQWIWADTFADASLTDGRYTLFRTALPVLAAVPESSTYAMMGLGVLLVLGAAQRARRRLNEGRIG